MKKAFRLLKWLFVLVIVVIFLQQVVTLIMPEGRKTKNEYEIYQIEFSDDIELSYSFQYAKINKGPYDIQYSEKIDESYDSISAKVIDYDEYSEMCKEFDIIQRYTNQNAEYIVWKAYGNSSIRWDLVNVITNNEVAWVYLKSSKNFFRAKNKSGRILIIPIEKGIIDGLGIGVGDAYRFDFERPVVDKPVIYLYPEKETEISVNLRIKDAELKCTYPEYKEGWKVVAKPDGTLLAAGREYSYLFWEAEARFPFTLEKGTCVAGKDTCKFLEDKLSQLGLSDKEQEDFITYWLPKMQDNPYNVISFQTEQYTDHFGLEISPKPDSVIRVFMTYKASEVYVDIEPEEFVTPARTGFTVVEWGGSEIQ